VVGDYFIGHCGGCLRFEFGFVGGVRDDGRVWG